MARQPTMPPYDKQVEAPLNPPDASVPLVQKQLPENIMWLSDGRGFRKRPGSLPFAVSQALTDDLEGEFVHTYRNWPCALLLVRTPATSLQRASYGTQDTKGGTFNDPYTLISVQWNGLATLQRRLAMTLSQDKVFSRAFGGTNSDSNYYVYSNGSMTPLSTVAPSTSVGSLAAAISPTATANQWAQQQELALLLKPETTGKTYFPTANVRKPWWVYQQKEVFNSANSNFGFRGVGGNSDRYDAVNLSGNVFVSGAGSTVLHYDGHRSYVAGAQNLSVPIDVGGGNLTSAGVGALTGTYKYFWTHVMRMPSGEVVEGVPSPVYSITTAAENVNVNYFNSTAFTTIFTKEYKYEAYSFTTAGGTVATITVNQAHNLEPGEYITFFINGARTVGQIQTVSGQVLMLATALTGVPGGTIWFSTGGGLRLYRTKTNGSVFYVRYDLAGPAQVNTPAPFTQLVDSAADNTLGTQYADTSFDRSAPPQNVTALAEHQGRLCILTNTSSAPEASIANGMSPSLCFTSASSAFYFPSGNYVSLPQTGYQNKARGLISINDTLYMFMNSSIVCILGKLDSQPTYSVQTLSSTLGCVDSRALIKIGSTIYFRSQEGLTMLSGNQMDSQWSAPIRKYLTSKTKTSLYYWPSKNLLLVSLLEPLEEMSWSADNGNFFATDYSPATDTAPGVNYFTPQGSFYHPGSVPAKTLVYNLTNQKWAVWNIDTYNGAVEVDGDLVVAPPLGSTSDPSYFIRISENCNWTDSGTAFTARYYSNWFDNSQPAVDKTFNHVTLFSTDTEEAGGQDFQLTVKTERDWSPGNVLYNKTLTDFRYGEGYAEQPYATTPYGDPERPYKMLPLGNDKVKSLRVILENSEANNDFVINAMELEGANPYSDSTDL